MVKYDVDLLNQHIQDCKVLTDLTQNLNRDTRIEFICSCGEKTSKVFRSIVTQGGPYCKSCTQQKTNKKNIDKNLIQYGVENVSQLQSIKDKKQETTLKNFGVSNPFQSDQIKNKIKITNVEKYGCENVSSNDTIKQKKISTTMNNYGVKNPFQSEKIKEQIVNNNLIKYGVCHVFQSLDVQEKIRKTMIERYNVDNPLKVREIKNKIIATNQRIYNYDYGFQSDIVINKIIATNIIKYGCKSPLQNPIIAEKASKNAYKVKTFIFSNGKTIKVSGYEMFALNILCYKEYINTDDIITERSQVPNIWYNTPDGKKHRYFVDIFIKSQQRCIEVKSYWTYEKNKEKVQLTKQAAIEMGFIFELWILDSKGNKVEVETSMLNI